MIDCRPKFKIPKNWSLGHRHGVRLVHHARAHEGWGRRSHQLHCRWPRRPALLGLDRHFHFECQNQAYLLHSLFHPCHSSFFDEKPKLNKLIWKNLYRVKLNKYSQTTRSSIAGLHDTTCTKLDMHQRFTQRNFDSDAHKLHAGNSCSADIATTNILQHTPHDNKHSKFCTYFFVISLTPSTCTYRSKILPKQIDRFYSRSDIDNTSCSRGSRFYSTGCLCASSMHDGVTWADSCNVRVWDGGYKIIHSRSV